MMMLLQNWSCPPPGRLLLGFESSSSTTRSRINYEVGRRKTLKNASNRFVSPLSVVDAITEIAHNKVLIAAVVSAAVGQLSKPFTAGIFYGDTFDFKASIQAGGFPSTHSAAAVATATCLGLERGFSDSVFGLAVVYASLTMYDAQGVRREVGGHAKTLNRILTMSELKSFSACDTSSSVDSTFGNSSSNLERLDPPFLEEPSDFRQEATKTSLLPRSDNRTHQSISMLISSSLAADTEGGLESCAHSFCPLKESVGHTEIEVIAGALLGFLVSLALHSV